MQNQTPYLVFDRQQLIRNYSLFNDSCKKIFSDYRIAYSIKTNSSDLVIKELAKQKSGFEIASLQEIKQAIKYNRKGFNIFNGPCKTDEELRLAIKNNFLINIDSRSELDKIIQLANGKSIDVGLRVVYNIQDSKFGIEEKKIKEIIEYAESNNLHIVCMQYHQGTQMHLKHFEDGIKGFVKTLEQIDLKLDFIDVGGGFPDKFQLGTLGLKLDDYFRIIKKYLEKFNATIILEPGRAIVSDTFELIARIIAIKENFNVKYAILDAGTNLLPRMAFAFYKFERMGEENKNKQKEEYILAGPLLFANDTFGKFHGHLEEGDLIKIQNVGAYCYNLAWEISYNKPRILIK